MLKGNQGQFGPVLRSMRQRLDITLRQLARGTAISSTYLSMIELGQVPPPSKTIIERIAEGLDVDPATLLLVAGRVPPSVMEAFHADPYDGTMLLRYFSLMSSEKAARLVAFARHLAFEDLPEAKTPEADESSVWPILRALRERIHVESLPSAGTPEADESGACPSLEANWRRQYPGSTATALQELKAWIADEPEAGVSALQELKAWIADEPEPGVSEPTTKPRRRSKTLGPRCVGCSARSKKSSRTGGS